MSIYYLAMYNDNVSIFEAIFISIFSMAIVFIILLIISYMIDITANIINKKLIKNIKNAKIVDDKSNEILSINKRDNGAEVAAIAAVVAMYLDTNVDNIKIVSIRRVNNESTWAQNGLFTQING